MKQQQHESKKKVKKKSTLRHLAKPVSLLIGLWTMTTLWQITAIIKIQEEPPETCQRQKQILLSKSKFFTHCPIQSLSQWRKYIVPRTFPVQKIGKYHPFNQGIYFERVWTGGTVSYHAF